MTSLTEEDTFAVLEPLDLNTNAPPKTRFLVDSDDDDDNHDNHEEEEEDHDDDEEEDNMHSPVRMRPPPRPTAGRKSISIAHAPVSTAGVTASAKRRRRRSSARFLRLTGRFTDTENDNDNNKDNNKGGGKQLNFADSAAHNGSSQEDQDDDDDDEQQSSQAQNLGELYKKAIRMNAENRINASNSWNLRLIENIDQFLMEDDEEDSADGAANGVGIHDKNSSSNNRHSSNNENETAEQGAMKNADPGSQSKHQSHRRVNFTKASCTLDASVKIYSYRVDDVHLTSYKVLANLNRTDTTGNSNNSSSKKQGDKNALSGDDSGDADGSENRNHRASKNGNTLETNVANMNLNKLDSAFDIDPLFHKMSKTFDEGGAKGLLLANLGVGSEGCNIVFDSSCEAVDLQQQTQKQKQQEATTDNDANADDNVNMDTGIDDMDTDNDNVVVATPPPPRQQEGMIDITTLKTKLDTLLALTGQSVHSLQLVPQLSSLRDEHNVLDAAGFIITEDTGTANQDEKGRSNSSKNASASSSARNGKDGGRYAADQQEEKEADRSIHQEAMERSRASLGGRSFLSQATTAGTGGAGGGHDDDDDEYGNDDFGGGGYDDGDDDDDGDDGFDNFMAMDENGARFSSISFNDNNNNSFTSPDSVDDHNHKPSATSVLLDAITDGNVIYGATDYQYFDAAAFASVSAAGAATDNVWAGAWHWKRGARRRPTTKNVTAESARKSRTKKSAKERVFVDLRLSPDMSDILRQPPARKAKGDPLQIGKTTLAKHAKTDNLLPLDAGMGVEKLSSLFLRPNTVLKASSTTTSFQQSQVSNGKTVGFDMAVETWGNGPDDSFGGGGDDGDDDDGPGFCFAGKADDDGGDFCVDELHDVRKVDKVRVGHATVAKKVDVKRLKRDLWLELESCFAVSTDSNSKEQEQYSLMPDDDEEETEQVDASPPPADGEQAAPLCLSFHEAVQDLEAAKSQSDVTLPFYFICVLHLANEKGLRLDSKGLEDFDIYKEDATGMQLF